MELECQVLGLFLSISERKSFKMLSRLLLKKNKSKQFNIQKKLLDNLKKSFISHSFKQLMLRIMEYNNGLKKMKKLSPYIMIKPLYPHE